MRQNKITPNITYHINRLQLDVMDLLEQKVDYDLHNTCYDCLSNFHFKEFFHIAKLDVIYVIKEKVFNLK